MASRVLLLGVTLVVALIRHRSPLLLWNEWDTVWFLGIATHGYHWSFDGKPAVAFFPVFPLLLHSGQSIGLDGVLAGMLIVNVAWLGALFYLFAWLRDCCNDATARRAMWLGTLFPSTLFTFVPYTESLFLLAAIATLFHARRQEVWITGLWLAVALTTRSTGLILIPAALVAAPVLNWRALVSLLSPTAAALAAWSLYLHAHQLSPVTVFEAQNAWHRSLAPPWTGFTTSLGWLWHRHSDPGWITENILSLAVVVLGLAATTWAWRYLDTSTRVYCALFWIIVLCTPMWRNGYFAPFSSADRFVVILFPLLGPAARTLTGRPFALWASCFAIGLTAATAVHLAGGWVG